MKRTVSLAAFVSALALLAGTPFKTSAHEILPFPETPSASVAGPTLATSTHQKRSIPKRLPDDAPNILVVLIDDVGPGQASTFGGEINTPALSRIYEEGIAFSRFHTTAMCSPTRAALLTGRNHHRVGNGQISEFANDWDGYSGVIPRSSATIAEVLGHYGYATSAFGKWHNTPVIETTEHGPYDNWPTGVGFDHFFGFLAGNTSQYEPSLVENTTFVEDEHFEREGYHLSEDLADQAIDWLNKHNALHPDQPFFMYWSSGAAHGPHQVPSEWADRYKGKFDDGWDVYRERVYERAKDVGWIPEDAELTPRPDTLQAWEAIPESERAFQLRLKEVYSGFIEHVDTQVDRLLDELDRLEYADNTIVLYVWGDNGASAEGLTGTLSEMVTVNGIVAPPSEQIEALERIGGLQDLGGPLVENMSHAGWSWAGGTPYKSTKLVAAHFGGTRNPLAIRWPSQIAPDATPRTQFHHVNDIVPTLYDLIGIEPPRVVAGVEQDPIDGISMAYTFADANAEDRKDTQYFEIYGSRGIYHDGWYAAAFGPRIPWVPGLPEGFTEWSPDTDQWELYNLEEDWSQANDLAEENPKKLEEMKALFLAEAEDNKAFPIGGAFWSTVALHPEDAPNSPRIEWVFRQPIAKMPEMAAPRIGGRPTHVTIEAEMGDAANGVLYATGGFPGGITLYVKDGFLHYEYNLFHLDRTKLASEERIPSGKVVIEVISTMDVPGTGGSMDVSLKVNGAEVDQGTVPRTAASFMSFSDGFGIGSDTASPVSADYYDMRPFPFDGTIHQVTARYIE